jgi:hypothetical protein
LPPLHKTTGFSDDPLPLVDPQETAGFSGDLKLILVDGVYAYPISFGLASGQVLYRSQVTLLPLSVNPRYRIRGTNV